MRTSLTRKKHYVSEPSPEPGYYRGRKSITDGAVDPFRLTASNVMDAKLHGATILTYQEVIEIIREQNRVIGVKVLDHKTNEIKSYYATIVVNAGGKSRDII